MQRALTLHQTTVGKKVIMAVSGFILVGFVIGHLLGNLQLYLGPEAINGYAAKLHSMPPVVWTARLVLLFCVGVHIVAAAQLWLRNRASRPGPAGRVARVARADPVRAARESVRRR